jgi:hypothetical protein
VKVHVRLTARDFFAFARWYYWHSPTMWIFALLATSLGMRRDIAAPGREEVTAVEVILMIIALALLLLFCWALLVAVGTVMLIVRNRHNQNCTVELSDEGIVEEMPNARLQIGWEALRKPGVTRRYLFLRGLPGSIQLIPKRAFPSEAAWSECVALVKRRAGRS